ncbi:MAG: HEAT repeat domain-containing protein [Planctomycetes bacterium]|nr:HEAT repeat domain-containing protein [Planctomycetota bacterium]
MAILILLLVLAPEETTRADEVAEALAKGDKPKAIAILKEIGTLKGNDAEALAVARLVRDQKVQKEPEVLEECFLALKGIGSRKVTPALLKLLDHSTLKEVVEVRIGVCRALQGSADPAGAEALLGLLHDREDRVIAASAEAAGAYRHAKEPVRKDLFKGILDVYESTWNLKNSVKPELKTEKRRAERKWEVIEAPMEKSLQLLSNQTQPDPPSWRRWWNKNKKDRWAELEN